MEALSKSELLALLAAARAVRERDWLMILVAYWHGLRASEVVSLTGDSIRDGFITVQRFKGSLRTTHKLIAHPDPLLNEHVGLLIYASGRLNNQRLFPVCRERFWRIVQKHAAAAGIPKHKGHPHVLKHSIAMHSIESAGVHNVKRYLGHKSLGSTGAYLEVSDEEASAAIERAARGEK